MNITQCLIKDLGSINAALHYAERIAQVNGALSYQYDCAARYLRAQCDQDHRKITAENDAEWNKIRQM